MSTPPPPSVEIQDVTKRFGAVTAVDGVSLAIGRGEFFALLGPSGCGKTTLLRMIAGLETPNAGTIRIGGQDVTRVPPHRRPANMVFQQYALFPHLTVEENVGFGLRYQGAAAGGARGKVAEALALVRLAGLEKRRPDQLSGGQRQRVALARALVLEPEVLLLDEPLAALDPNLRREVQVELKALQRELGITFVFVTHDREEALAMSDRMAVMNQGQVEQVGSPAAVFEAPETEFIARFLGATNVFTAEVRRARKAGVLTLELPDGTELAVPAAGAADAAAARAGAFRGAAGEARPARRPLPRRGVAAGDGRGPRLSRRQHRVDRPRARRRALHRPRPERRRGELPFAAGSPAFLGWEARHSVLLRE